MASTPKNVTSLDTSIYNWDTDGTDMLKKGLNLTATGQWLPVSLKKQLCIAAGSLKT